MTRHEQKEHTRQRILEGALDSFLERGFYGTKTSQIARRAGVSEGLLFYHFGTKEGILEALIQIGLNGMRVPETISADTGIGHFEAFTHMLFQHVKKNLFSARMFVFMGSMYLAEDIPDRLRLLARSVDAIGFSRRWIDLGHKDGTIRSGDSLALSNMFWTCIHGIMEHYAVNPDIPLPEPDWILCMLRPDKRARTEKEEEE